MNTKKIYSDESKQRDNFLFPARRFFFGNFRFLSFLIFDLSQGQPVLTTDIHQEFIEL
jgi:hypothetical protein